MLFGSAERESQALSPALWGTICAASHFTVGWNVFKYPRSELNAGPLHTGAVWVPEQHSEGVFSGGGAGKPEAATNGEQAVRYWCDLAREQKSQGIVTIGYLPL